MYSLIVTAKMNDIDPQAWLADVLARIVGQHWFATGWAIIGGLGVNSDFLYDVMGGVGYEWNNGVSAFAGYRIADPDYSEGDFE